MKTEKVLIERTLKFSERYTYLSISRGSIMDGDCQICDNCGKLITNVVTVGRNTDGKRFNIGTDCAETLAKAKCMFNSGNGYNGTDFWYDISRLNEANRFMTQAKKNPEGVELDWMYARVSYKTSKGEVKEAKCFKSVLEDFYPNFYNSLQEQAA